MLGRVIILGLLLRSCSSFFWKWLVDETCQAQTCIDLEVISACKYSP